MDIVQAARDILKIADKSFPTIGHSPAQPRRVLTQCESIARAKYLLGNIPVLVQRGDERPALIALGQAQGLLFSVGIEDPDALEKINKGLAA